MDVEIFFCLSDACVKRLFQHVNRKKKCSFIATLGSGVYKPIISHFSLGAHKDRLMAVDSLRIVNL